MATVNGLAARNPFLAAAVSPEHPEVRFRLARFEFGRRQGRVSPETRAASIDALRRSALSEDAFLLSGVQAIADGDPRRGDALLEESRRRNPRSRLTRLILVDRYVRADRIDDAAIELAALNRLVPQAGSVLAPELARMARDPKTSTAAARLLGRSPEMRDAVLTQLATAGAPTAQVLSIAAQGRPSPTGAQWQTALIEKMVSRGELGAAYALWRRFAGLGPDGGAKGVYDSNFAGAKGGPPFNWELTSGGEGVAERSTGPSLQADYFGRAPARLAHQLLLLRPGTYRLQLAAEGSAKGQGSRMIWTVTCLGKEAPLLALPVVDVAASGKRLQGSFTVPASGCPAQAIDLAGTPGDVPSTESATFTGLTLAPAGRP